ncbi:GNAT family N-acetyltransferase [Phototrophicus methaneseepsis]|uniref:GNAT family N-acetyltransferase n=1 Tax=Phototrophicus methaneseepsis TaxID=2710758 RepID=A0A7S8EDP5_9CHLR|nr:GNAT family N-acetyltransferase [Phototrophicus methaneseepsis]QPC85072.1 GNAT family N-acetyltransferase [Phototrophicus methaneseepsis]
MAFAVQQSPQSLVTTYLEMTSRTDFAPSFVQYADVRVEALQSPDVDFYRFLYQSVGEKWCWRDRLLISRDELASILQAPSTHVYVLYVKGTPAGYVELCAQGESVEVAYFGLREPFFGRGLGKHLLSYGIQQAWMLGARRVWLHTCNLDGPHALANYQKRGFKVFKQVAEPMPERYM